MKPQKKDGWCGPAALSYALKELGITKTQEEIAKKSGTTTKNGVDPNALRDLAREYGLKVKTMSGGNPSNTLATLKKEKINGSSILLDYLMGDSMADGHYVVYEKSNNGKIQLKDPATGKEKIINQAYFISHWKDTLISGKPFKYWAMVLTKKRSYKDLHKKSMDELLEESETA